VRKCNPMIGILEQDHGIIAQHRTPADDTNESFETLAPKPVLKSALRAPTPRLLSPKILEPQTRIQSKSKINPPEVHFCISILTPLCLYWLRSK
jgi:hypothetical protein